MSLNIGDLVIGLETSNCNIRKKVGRIIEIRDSDRWYNCEFGLFEGEKKDFWYVREDAPNENITRKEWAVKLWEH